MKTCIRSTIVLMFWLFVVGILQAGAQKVTVKGTVVSAQDELLAGVSVVETGTTNGTITDMNGNFTISLSKIPSELTFSYLGFITQKVNVIQSNKGLEIVLREDVEQLEEVVVVGYGTQKKASLTGSVVAIDNTQLMTTKGTNIQNMLTGKLPGLRVVQNTSEPGQFTNMFDIRGLGSPLFVIDGVPRDEFARLDPNDIESISILKDASAAIYGVRAANGVVLITTKTGAKQKASIEYNGYYGIQTPAEILKPVNAYNYGTLRNEQSMRNINTPSKKYSDQWFQDLANGLMPDTDWYDAIMRNTAPQQQHNISVKGGTDKVSYYINGGYNSQESFWKTNSNNYKRYNLRTNLDAEVIKGLKVAVKLNFIMDETKRQATGSDVIFKDLWSSLPIEPIYANNKAPYYNHPASANVAHNVAALIHPEVSGEVSNKKTMLQSNLALNYKLPFIKGLSTNFMFSYDKTFNDNSTFTKGYNEYTYNEANDTYNTYPMNGKTKLDRFYSTSFARLWNWSINYENTFVDRHHVNAMLLWEESYSQGYDLSGSRYMSIPIPYLFAGDADGQIATGSGLTEKANKALVGRINYDFKDKYLFEFTFRYDGSSKFPKGKQWGFFPSVQLGYRISEEAFFKEKIPFINNLKIRGSWGKLGDDGASQFQFVEGYDYPVSGAANMKPAGAVFGGTFVNGIGFRNAPNWT